MPSYFGTCDIDGNSTLSNPDDSTGWNFCAYTGASFTCPGSGPMKVVELSAPLGILSGSPNIRLALYDDGDQVVCQGLAPIAVANTGAWQGHKNAELSPPEAIITGGKNYRISLSRDAGGILTTVNSPGGTKPLGDMDYGATDFASAGFSQSIPSGTDYDGWLSAMRCGVIRSNSPANRSFGSQMGAA